jgi:hypothetical protein
MKKATAKDRAEYARLNKMGLIIAGVKVEGSVKGVYRTPAQQKRIFELARLIFGNAF